MTRKVIRIPSEKVVYAYTGTTWYGFTDIHGDTAEELEILTEHDVLLDLLWLLPEDQVNIAKQVQAAIEANKAIVYTYK